MSDEMIDVIIKLKPVKTNNKELFQQETQPIIEQIEKMGGTVKGLVWINRTLKVSIPNKDLDTLSTLEIVESVGESRKLQAE